MIRKIVDAKDPVLRKKAKPVKKFDKKLLSLIKDLKDTIIAQKDPEGVGLAAPQIGKSLRVFAIKPKDKVRIFVNTKLLSVSKEKTSDENDKKTLEGCLSIPNFYGPLKRAKKVKIKYQDAKGNEKTEELTGLSARIILHEIDHLNGVLFTDHILKQKKKLYENIDGEWEEVDLII